MDGERGQGGHRGGAVQGGGGGGVFEEGTVGSRGETVGSRGMTAMSGVSEGGGGDMSTDTVRFKERRKMLYPWMRDMYKEGVDPEVVEEKMVVKKLDTFKPPNTKSQRFY